MSLIHSLVCSMNQSVFVPQEMEIVLATTPQAPTIVTPEFLKLSGVLPENWELSRAPIYTQQVVQLAYQTGVTITAQPNRIIFTQPIHSTEPEALHIAEIAQRFAKSLPNLQIEAIGINPSGHVVFETPDAVGSYVRGKFLGTGDWQTIEGVAVKPQLQLSYPLSSCVFHLSIQEARLRNEDETLTPILIFSGNFSYTVAGTTSDERFEQIRPALSNWQVDLERFQKIVTEQFLATSSAPTLLPAFAA